MIHAILCGRFTPEELGVSASSLLAWLVAEVVLIWIGMFLARVSASLSWLDILAYCGYKYIRLVIEGKRQTKKGR